MTDLTGSSVFSLERNPILLSVVRRDSESVLYYMISRVWTGWGISLDKTM